MKKKKEETAEVGGVRKKTLLKFGTRTLEMSLFDTEFRFRILFDLTFCRRRPHGG